MSMRLVIKESEMEKLWKYTDLCNDEIAAFGYITAQDDGDLFVDEVFLVPQQVSGAEVDFMSQGLPYAIQKASVDGRLNDLRFLWHSHVNMGVSHSHVDETMIASIRDSGPIPWLVTAIFNKKGDTNGRLDLFKNAITLPGCNHISGIKLGVFTDAPPEEKDEATLKEIEALVKKRKWESKSGKKGGKQIPATTGQQHSHAPDGFMDGGGKAVSELTEHEMERELSFAQDMYTAAKNGKWEGYEDSDGWMYWFDDTDFKGSCMSLEDDEDDGTEGS